MISSMANHSKKKKKISSMVNGQNLYLLVASNLKTIHMFGMGLYSKNKDRPSTGSVVVKHCVSGAFSPNYFKSSPKSTKFSMAMRAR